MKYPMSGFKLGVCALALGLSGWANAACYIGPETKAASVQSDSGNGTYSCSLTSSATTGLPLYDVTSQATITPNPDGTVNWSVLVQDGYQLNVDLVSVSSNSGKRCNYSYPSLTASGDNLSTTVTGDTSRKTVTICATSPNPILTELPPPPEPFSTAKDGCDATFTDAGNGKFDVAIGYSKQYEGGLYEGVAICAGTGQKQCVNECVPREYSTDPSICAANPDGTLPLACAQCEWDAPADLDTLFGQDMKYCWYYENRVDTTAGTFKPSPKKKSVSTQIDVSTGSNCYTVTSGPLYGGKTYSYWYCPQ